MSYIAAATVHTFSGDTEISGYMAVRLWVEADGCDDMDLAVSVRKHPGLLDRLSEMLPGLPDGNAAAGCCACPTANSMRRHQRRSIQYLRCDDRYA